MSPSPRPSYAARRSTTWRPTAMPPKPTARWRSSWRRWPEMAATVIAADRPARPSKRESLADVLRRRSNGDSAGEQQQRAIAVQSSLSAVTRGAEGNIVDVPLDALLPNPFQPRFHFQRRPLEELAQSLAG